MTITPFECRVPDSVIDDLYQRLDNTRWPDQLPGVGWDYGTERGFLQKLCDHWRHRFDWRAAEAKFNAFPQFMTEIGGETVHFYHISSLEPDALPLIITHGYPGSVAEFLDIFGPLTDPAKHGGDRRDAFHVIAPSIPGYGFSGPTRTTGFDIGRAADVNIALMEMLGYDRYVAQGGDWGSAISTAMAVKQPERVIALHLNFITGHPADPANPHAGLSEAEVKALEWKANYDRWESGYQAIQGTKPQSIAYGLNDSPAGLAGWIVEKFKTWSDCGDAVESFSKDKLLENIMLYWVTGTINSAMRLYYEVMAPNRWKGVPADKVAVPTGHARFPAEIRPTPRLWAEQIYTNLIHWREMPAGGHFAADEQPEAFVDELRGFFRQFRG